jgi:hypothetical protein
MSWLHVPFVFAFCFMFFLSLGGSVGRAQGWRVSGCEGSLEEITCVCFVELVPSLFWGFGVRRKENFDFLLLSLA